MSTQNPVNAPQFGRGISVLQEAQERRSQTQKEIAQKKRVDEEALQAQINARRERMNRVEKAIQRIAGQLTNGKHREAREIAVEEINCLLEELKVSKNDQDRFWIAKKVLHFTSWQGWKALSDVEETISFVFRDSIPDEIAESLARLIDKQTEFLHKTEAKKAGIMRFGKTKRDRQSGALKQHQDNRASRAEENRQRAHGGNGQVEQKKKK